MAAPGIRLTAVDGPTALVEFAGARLLTDPTFDPGGTEYRTPVYVLRKTTGPAIGPDGIGDVDAVLLSHYHHFDNLDREGRRFLDRASVVVTTTAGAERLGGGAVGLDAWQSADIKAADGRIVRVTATPARHGPADGDRGPVIGFLLADAGAQAPAAYISGDSVWYDGVAEVARRFTPGVAVLFAGAARVPAVGPSHLTFTAAEMVVAARAFAQALIVPLHVEGWEHFSEGRADIERAFEAAGLSSRLRWPEPGRTIDLA